MLTMKRSGRFFSRDRAAVAGGLILICALAWAWLAPMHMAPSTIPAPAPMHGHPWTSADAWSVFLMWTIMMAAMMIPGATPMVLEFAHTKATRRVIAEVGLTLIFLVGYLGMWAAFSAIATLAQWALQRNGLLSMTMASSSATAAALTLLAAGVFQFTRLKRQCLVHCRSPMHTSEPTENRNALAAFTMGLHHGLFCVGGCWALMALLFVFGVMNLYAVALLTTFVLLEKVLPRPGWLTRGAGVAFITWGLSLLVT